MHASVPQLLTARVRSLPPAVEQGFTPSASSPNENEYHPGDSLSYGCSFTHPPSHAKCSLQYKLVYDPSAGEDVVVEACTEHDHPLSDLDPVETRKQTEKTIEDLKAEQVRCGPGQAPAGEGRS